MASPTRWTWVWVNSGSWWWTGRPGVLCGPWGCKELDTTERLNWTEHGCVHSSSVTKSCPALCHPMDCSSPQAPLSVGFSSQEDWNGLPLPPPGDLPDSGMEPACSAWQTDALPLYHPGSSSSESTILLQSACYLRAKTEVSVHNLPHTTHPGT